MDVLAPVLCPRCWGSKLQPQLGLSRMLRVREPCGRCRGDGHEADLRLTDHFTLGELVRSATAVRFGIPNEPNDDEVARLHELATSLEAVRAALGVPVDVDSAFRGLALNAAVGSEPTSAHVVGWAADLKPRGITIGAAVARLRVSGIPRDQLICEGSWVHWGLRQPRTGAQRMQCFSLLPGPGGKRVVADFDPADPRVQVMA